MSPRGPEVKAVAGAVLLGLLLAIGGYWALSALSTPQHFGSRLADAEARITRAQSLANQPHDASVYLRHALCRGSPDQVADMVRMEVARAAEQARVTAPQVVVTPVDAQGGEAGAYPVMFTVETMDRYDLVLAFLGRLSQAEPQVFADTLDLTSKTSAVSLKLTGRVLCSTPS